MLGYVDLSFMTNRFLAFHTSPNPLARKTVLALDKNRASPSVFDLLLQYSNNKEWSRVDVQQKRLPYLL